MRLWQCTIAACVVAVLAAGSAQAQLKRASSASAVPGVRTGSTAYLSDGPPMFPMDSPSDVPAPPPAAAADASCCPTACCPPKRCGLFDWLLRRHAGCCAEPTCCAAEPACCEPAEPACCAPAEPACCAPAEPACCAPAPACCGHRGGLLHSLFGHSRCGCAAEAACCAPAACPPEPLCCAPYEPPTCAPPPAVCCAPHGCRSRGLLDWLFPRHRACGCGDCPAGHSGAPRVNGADPAPPAPPADLPSAQRRGNVTVRAVSARQ